MPRLICLYGLDNKSTFHIGNTTQFPKILEKCVRQHSQYANRESRLESEMFSHSGFQEHLAAQQFRVLFGVFSNVIKCFHWMTALNFCTQSLILHTRDCKINEKIVSVVSLYFAEFSKKKKKMQNAMLCARLQIKQNSPFQDI